LVAVLGVASALQLVAVAAMTWEVLMVEALAER
jgi:hypothetical protein